MSELFNKNNNVFYKIFKKLHDFYGPQFWWPAKTALEVIIGAILTQNTSWKNVEKAVKNLKRHKILSVKKLTVVKVERLARLIRSSGYYNIKAQRIKNFINFLNENCQGSLKVLFSQSGEFLREQLLSVNGLGPETVDSILLYAGGKPVFVIDAYTKRIFSRHGLISEENTYIEIQKKFLDNLNADIELFNEYHALIVKLGKNVCKRKPLCDLCPLRTLKKE